MKYLQQPGDGQVSRQPTGTVGSRPQRRTQPEVADRFRYGATTVYTPERLRALFDAANSGDIEQLCLCGREMLERNWDIIGAMEQRADAIQGLEFDVQPGGATPADAAAAKAFEEALRSCGELNGLDTFHDLVGDMTSAVIMPFSASEIVWGAGGTLDGFAMIEPHHFTLRDGFVPRLVCDEWPGGMPEEETVNRFVFHQFRRKADPARSGKIRVLAWLHCFQNWPIKDLFSFIERFGMPFVVAKVDKKTWDEERNALHALIRNFGPNGGGVFTQGTELQLLNAANTGGDNVYFKALEFTHDAIYTLLVGQLASSGESAGLSKGDAQTAVRQDILEADARTIEATVRARIAAPWTRFNCGPDVAVPKIHFQVEPADDLAALATTVATLFNAGLEADPAEMSEKFGLKLTKRDMTQLAPVPGAMAFAAEPRSGGNVVSGEKDGEPELAKALEAWLGPIADKVGEVVDLPDEEFDQVLKAGFTPHPGDAEHLERLGATDMARERERGYQI